MSNVYFMKEKTLKMNEINSEIFMVMRLLLKGLTLVRLFKTVLFNTYMWLRTEFSNGFRTIVFYRLQTKLREGNVFRGVCLSTWGGGGCSIIRVPTFLDWQNSLTFPVSFSIFQYFFNVLLLSLKTWSILANNTQFIFKYHFKIT